MGMPFRRPTAHATDNNGLTRLLLVRRILATINRETV